MRRRFLMFPAALLTGPFLCLGVYVVTGSQAGKGAAVTSKRYGTSSTISAARRYRSPFLISFSPNGKTLYVSDRTAGCVVVVDPVHHKKLREIPLSGQPTGLAVSPDGKRLYVAEYGAGAVAVVDTNTFRVNTHIAVGLRPMGLALSGRTKRLFVCNSESACVSVIDTTRAKVIGRIPAIREPQFAALTPDEAKLVVTNMLPLGRGTDPTLAAAVSIMDAKSLKQVKSIRLPAGSTNVCGVCIAPDGCWAYVAHTLARFNVPPTQLERGWVNTNAFTIIDLKKNEWYATLLLDSLMEGAADPFGIICSTDGNRLFVSLRGVNQVCILDRTRLHDLLEGKVPDELRDYFDASTQNPWQSVGQSPSREAREPLMDDLSALYMAEVVRRVPSGGPGPHGLALSPDERTLFIANYYAGIVTAFDVEKGKQLATISMGPQPQADMARKGEIAFHDAIITFQHWHSCATCHPNQARVDALNWDLLNDGIGNPKNNKSLLYSHKTPPSMSRAIREDYEVAVRAGFRFIQFCAPSEETIQAVMAYIRSLMPEPSPFLGPGGRLTAAAQRGKKIFEGKAQCARCHPAPLFTDKKAYDVGTRAPDDTDPDGIYDTPSLIECYRTAPYLHDGRAESMEEVFTHWNKKDRHGKTSKLTRQELDDLVIYLLSL